MLKKIVKCIKLKLMKQNIIIITFCKYCFIKLNKKEKIIENAVNERKYTDSTEN